MVNGELANQVGNLIARLSHAKFYPRPLSLSPCPFDLTPILEAMDQHKFHHALQLINAHWSETNRLVNELAPWRLNSDSELESAMNRLWSIIRPCAWLLSPIIPQATSYILGLLGEDEVKDVGSLAEPSSCQLRLPDNPPALFPRIKL